MSSSGLWRAALTIVRQELTCHMDSSPSIKPTSVARFVRALGGSIVPVSQGSWPLSTWQPTAIEVVFADCPAHIDRRSLCFESVEELGRRLPYWASSQAHFDLYLQRIADHYVRASDEERAQIKAWMGLRFEAQWKHSWHSTFASLAPSLAESKLGPGWLRRYLNSRIAELLAPPLDTWTHALPKYITAAQARLLQESFTHLAPRRASRARL